MTKAEEAGPDVGHDEAITTHIPMVAEGSGKTANNAGATQREVHNVRVTGSMVKRQ